MPKRIADRAGQGRFGRVPSNLCFEPAPHRFGYGLGFGLPDMLSPVGRTAVDPRLLRGVLNQGNRKGRCMRYIC
jgi:hypothetical protein